MERRVIALTRPDQRHMHAHIISATKRFFEADVLDGGGFFLQALFVAKIHQLLRPLYEAVILIGGIEAQYVHVEARALADHCLPDASSADDCNGLARYLIAQKRQKRMPRTP